MALLGPTCLGRACYSSLPLSIPKRLVIQNRRLNILFNVFFLIAAIAVTTNFFLGQNFTSKVGMLTELVVTAETASLSTMVEHDEHAADFCQRTPPQTSDELDIRCIGVCHFDVWQPQCCVNPQDIIRQQAYNEIFVATDAASHNIGPLGSVGKQSGYQKSPFNSKAGFSMSCSTLTSQAAVDVLRNKTYNNNTPPTPTSDPPGDWLTFNPLLKVPIPQEAFRHELIPSVVNLALKFGYKAALNGEPPWSPWRRFAWETTSDLSVTAVLSRDGTVAKSFDPGVPVVLPLPEVVAYSHSLPRHYEDKLPSLHLDLMISGAEIDVRIFCFNTLSDALAKIREGLGGSTADLPYLSASTDRPLCLMNFTFVAVPGIRGMARVELEVHGPAGIATVHQRIGIRVGTSAGSGFMRFFDFSEGILHLTSAFVLLGIPAKLFGFLALFGLGAISKTYRRAAWQKYAIDDECGAVALRLATHSVPYLELADKDEGISLGRMTERLQSVLRHRDTTMDEDEIKRLAAFCFQQVALQSCRASPTKDYGSTQHDAIDIDAFSVAMSSNDPLCFDEIIELFDCDRKKTCLETFFTPHFLWGFVHDKDVNVDGDCSSPVSLELRRSRTQKSMMDASQQVAHLLNREGDLTQHLRGLQAKQLSMEAQLTKRLEHVMRLLGSEEQKVRGLQEQLTSVAQLTQRLEHVMQLLDSEQRKVRGLEEQFTSVAELTKQLEHVMQLLDSEQQKARCLQDQLMLVQAEGHTELADQVGKREQVKKRATSPCNSSTIEASHALAGAKQTAAASSYPCTADTIDDCCMDSRAASNSTRVIAAASTQTSRAEQAANDVLSRERSQVSHYGELHFTSKLMAEDIATLDALAKEAHARAASAEEQAAHAYSKAASAEAHAAQAEAIVRSALRELAASSDRRLMAL